MLIGELINNLAQKAGVKSDSEELKSLLASPELANVKVPEELVSTIDKGLLSIEAAKNNHPDIKKKYFADAYDGMDKQLMALVANDTFDASDIDEIAAEKSTSKKAELIVSKLKAAKASAKGADKEEINRQLAAAHEAARIAKSEVEAVKNTYEGKIKDINKKAALKAVLSNYKTIYDDLPGNVKITSMEALINNALQDKNAELNVDDNGNLLLISKDGSNVFGSNHVQLTPASFLDQSFAPILKVSGPQKPAATQQQPNIPIATQAKGSEATVSQISSHNAQVMADMAAPRSSMM
jgi:hypothetical protein